MGELSVSKDIVGLGDFGDRRLQKGGRVFWMHWFAGPVRTSASWHRAIERARCSFRAFCTMRR